MGWLYTRDLGKMAFWDGELAAVVCIACIFRAEDISAGFAVLDAETSLPSSASASVLCASLASSGLDIAVGRKSSVC